MKNKSMRLSDVDELFDLQLSHDGIKTLITQVIVEENGKTYIITRG